MRSKVNHWRALIDRGANGSIAGNDMKVIRKTGQSIDLSGIDDHTIRNLPIVDAGGVTRTQKGDIILVVHQTAYMPEGRSIISTGQLEHFKIKVDEKPLRVTGKVPTITTLEGYEVPICIRHGLPYIQLQPYTDDEWNTLPKIAITSPHPWRPSVLDSRVDDSWYARVPDPDEEEPEHLDDSPFDEMGRLRETPDEIEEESDTEDRNARAIDRNGIKAFFCDLIRDEMQESFTVCNIEGELHTIRWDEPWQNYLESDNEDPNEEPPSLAARGHSSSEDESSDDEPRRRRGYRVHFESDSDSGKPPALASREDLSESSDSDSSDDEGIHSKDRIRTCFPITRSASRRKSQSKDKQKQISRKASKKTRTSNTGKKTKVPKARKPRKKKKDEFRDRSRDDPDPDDNSSE
jgi:hypothetical protein